MGGYHQAVQIQLVADLILGLGWAGYRDRLQSDFFDEGAPNLKGIHNHVISACFHKLKSMLALRQSEDCISRILGISLGR